MNRTISSATALAAAGIFILAVFTVSLIKAEAGEEAHAVAPVESEYVCMITDRVYDKEQIPVEIEDKTYYGCCEMCESKLKSDPESRKAVDPVSGAQVDKASAVIGATPEGNIYYFESEENLKAYDKGAKSGE